MEECGSNIMACLPDPSVDPSAVTDTTKVHSVVTHHSHFTMDKASKAAKAQSIQCNKCDGANDMDAKDPLCKSINANIQDELNLVKEEKSTFIKHWMEVVSIICLPIADNELMCTADTTLSKSPWIAKGTGTSWTQLDCVCTTSPLQCSMKS